MSSRPTVIIADDSRTFRMYFSTLLSRMNFDVMPVASGSEALDLARVISPHMIALDVRMADQNGIETLQQIRNDKKLNVTPVVMISGHADHAEDCFAAGCSDFLTKPINLEHLHIALQKCQKKREGMRKHLRAPFNRTVHFSYNNKLIKSHAVTLSEGGIFLRTSDPLTLGSRLEIDIPLEKKELMMLCGEVIYTMGEKQGNLTLPPGMAIRFDSCEKSMRQRLGEEVKELLAGDILEKQEQNWFCDGQEYDRQHPDAS